MTDKILPVALVQKSLALVERTHQTRSRRDLPKMISSKRNAIAVAMLPEAFLILRAVVHSYRDEPDREWRWALFVPAARIREYDNSADRFAEELRRMAEPALVDDYADAKADALLNTLQEIRKFRDDLYGATLAELAGRVSTQPEEIQERLRWIPEANERWRWLLTPRTALADHEADGDPPGADGEES